jgi:S-adenosylmethionine:tRNA ribosyltransferase-isomerase
MEETRQETLTGDTSIFIKPGYQFRVCHGLITNFHQPASTLILLIASFIGKDWKQLYDNALKNGYRFLSFGDSSLLLP